MTPPQRFNGNTVLFISHKQKRCGVHQYGLNISGAIRKSTRYRVLYAECSEPEELKTLVKAHQPSAILYNYHPATLPWLTKEITRQFGIPQIGTIHEITQDVGDAATADVFDYYVAPDPTLAPNNPIVFKTGRVIPEYVNRFDPPPVFTIGSFGMAGAWKDYERVIIAVQEEFDSAVIRLHIPVADFVDVDVEEKARALQRLVIQPGVRLVLSHNFMSQAELLDFLAQNTLNVFFYPRCEGRGISSVISYALAAQRPIAVTRSEMFRHILKGNAYMAEFPICVEPEHLPRLKFKAKLRAWLKRRRYQKRSRTKLPLHWFYPPAASLRTIAQNGFKPLETFRSEWSEGNLIMDYERILDRVLGRLPSAEAAIPSASRGRAPLEPVGLPHVTQFNRILDNAARSQYQPAIDQLFDLCPELMRKKIAEANVQQAFVMDTVQKFAGSSRRLLCVGSYEDTAAEGLKRLGYAMDEVDPVLNVDFSTFFHRSPAKGVYDVIFATSVLEHVRNDELFITQIVDLLAPSGVGILTFDYQDQYQCGDPLPSVDFRFYTQNDLRQRILPLLKGCALVDPPRWDCPNPDFVLDHTFRYTFGTLVFEKRPEPPPANADTLA